MFVTVRDIAKELCVTKGRVNYALREKGVVPVLVAGQTRLYYPSAVPLVRAAMKAIAARHDPEAMWL